MILSGSLVVVERLISVLGTGVSKEAKERNKLICNPLMQHTPTLSFLHTTALVVRSKKVMLLLRMVETRNSAFLCHSVWKCSHCGHTQYKISTKLLKKALELICGTHIFCSDFKFSCCFKTVEDYIVWSSLNFH